ncbi:MAG: hypothetical protein ACLVDB_06290 [Anaeromassilibacillus sp.]
MDAILRRVKDLAASMAEELHRGRVAAVPLKGDTDAASGARILRSAAGNRRCRAADGQRDRDAALAELTRKGSIQMGRNGRQANGTRLKRAEGRCWFPPLPVRARRRSWCSA